MDGHVYLDHNPWTAQSGIYRDCQHKGRVERVGVKCTRTIGPIFEQWSKPWFKPPLNHAETWSV